MRKNNLDQISTEHFFDKTEAPEMPIEREFCSSCGDQEGGCQQCGWGRERKKFLTQQAVEKERKRLLAEEDIKKIRDSFEKH